MTIENLIKENIATIIDVRSYGEFMGGNVSGSINIPLQEILNRLDEIKQREKPLILCCESGNRSGQAYNFLAKQDVECINGGSWLEVNYLQSQTV